MQDRGGCLGEHHKCVGSTLRSIFPFVWCSVAVLTWNEWANKSLLITVFVFEAIACAAGLWEVKLLFLPSQNKQAVKCSVGYFENCHSESLCLVNGRLNISTNNFTGISNTSCRGKYHFLKGQTRERQSLSAKTIFNWTHLQHLPVVDPTGDFSRLFFSCRANQTYKSFRK